MAASICNSTRVTTAQTGMRSYPARGLFTQKQLYCLHDDVICELSHPIPHAYPSGRQRTYCASCEGRAFDPCAGMKETCASARRARSIPSTPQHQAFVQAQVLVCGSHKQVGAVQHHVHQSQHALPFAERLSGQGISGYFGEVTTAAAFVAQCSWTTVNAVPSFI